MCVCLLLQVSCECHEVLHAAVRGAQGERDVQTPHSNLHQDDIRGDSSLPPLHHISLSLPSICYLHLQLKLYPPSPLSSPLVVTGVRSTHCSVSGAGSSRLSSHPSLNGPQVCSPPYPGRPPFCQGNAGQQINTLN